MSSMNNPYHLVENSMNPMSMSMMLGTMLLSFVNMMHFMKYPMLMYNLNMNEFMMMMSIMMFFFNFFFWMYEMMQESFYQGFHTSKVQNGLSIGFSLFVLSEILIFSSLFFAYFYNSLIPSVELGGLWPAMGMETLNYKSMPLLNTLMLFFSGITMTSSHNFLLANKKYLTLFYLFLTIFLGLIFTFFQYFEYLQSSFDLTSSFYGSSFFVLTSFHGMHVMMGTTFLLTSLISLILNHFSINHHLNFSFSSMYWHVIDLMWMFLYAFLYMWGS